MKLNSSDGDLASRLLAWYERERRALPWRARRGVVSDPYRVWLSEVMLQQTTVASAEPYFRAFIARWPTLEMLAAARRGEVLHAWQGLGYYARARNLHSCAQEVSRRPGARFPDNEAELARLPGIGPYSAAAIAAIAFQKRAVVVDGNVIRVMARLFAVEQPLPGARQRLYALAERLTPEHRPGDYAQAVMDLGALVCTPRRPECGRCPWGRDCLAHARGIAESLPRRAQRRPRPVRHGVAFLALTADGRALFRRRPERGLLGGMMEVPSTPWRDEPWSMAEARGLAPLAARWRALEGAVRHTFTHFRLELEVLTGRPEAEPTAHAGVWHPLERVGELALPTVMKKVLHHAGAAFDLPDHAGRRPPCGQISSASFG